MDFLSSTIRFLSWHISHEAIKKLRYIPHLSEKLVSSDGVFADKLVPNISTTIVSQNAFSSTLDANYILLLQGFIIYFNFMMYRSKRKQYEYSEGELVLLRKDDGEVLAQVDFVAAYLRPLSFQN